MMERIPDIIFDEKAATASLHRKHKPTNPLAAVFGEPKGDIKKMLKKLKQGGPIEISQEMARLA